MSLGLLGSYYSSSSDSEDEDCDKNEATKKIDETKVPEYTPKLANPFLKSASNSLKPSYMVDTEDLSATNKDKKLSCEGATSVFNNPFQAKEDRKKAILEQHVEMTTKQEDQTRKIGDKKICWNFRKGRCRFGHKCTFAHDSDVASSLASAAEKAKAEENSDQQINYSIGLLSDSKTIDPMKPSLASVESRQKGTSQLRKFNEQQMKQMLSAAEGHTESSESSAVISNNKRKVRPGLSDDIVPGKKAIKFYNKIYGNNL